MDFPSEISEPVKRRRRHSPQFKAQVLEETLQPGASIAAVAQRHNLNANLIHKWRLAAQRQTSEAPAFIPLPAPGRPSQAEVRIELPIGQGGVNLFWPCDQARSLAELLKSLA